MTFVEYVGFYQLARSEGLVLRYLADAYRALRQTVPDEAKTEELADIEEWLGELVRQVDSRCSTSGRPSRRARAAVDSAPPPLDDGPDGVTRNVRAFRVLVRNALFRRVELAALRRWDLLGELDGEAGWDADAWREALQPYFAEYGDTVTAIGTGPDARGPQPGDDHRGARALARPPGARRPRGRPRLGDHRRGRPRGVRRGRRGRRLGDRRRPRPLRGESPFSRRRIGDSVCRKSRLAVLKTETRLLRAACCRRFGDGTAASMIH